MVKWIVGIGVFLLGILGGSPPVNAGGQTPAGEVSFREIPGTEGEEGVEAAIRIPASTAEVWRVLTGYDRLSEFIPDLLVSRVIGEEGGDPIVYQQGKTRVLFYIFRSSVTLRVHEESPHRLAFVQTTGDFEYFHGEWRLAPLNDGKATELTYTLWAHPKFYVPHWLVEAMLKRDIPKRLSALRDRILQEFPPVRGAGAP